MSVSNKILLITRRCNFIYISVDFAFKDAFSGEREFFFQIWQWISLWQWSAISAWYYQAGKIFIWKWHEIAWFCRGKVPLPFSGVYYKCSLRSSQLRTMVFNIYIYTYIYIYIYIYIGLIYTGNCWGCSCWNGFPNDILHYWNYWRYLIGQFNDKQCSKSSVPRYGWRARHVYVAMHWNGGLVEASHYNVNRVLSAKHTYATDFFLKLWYDSFAKSISHYFSRKILAQDVKNMHDHIFILYQKGGWFRQ